MFWRQASWNTTRRRAVWGSWYRRAQRSAVCRRPRERRGPLRAGSVSLVVNANALETTSVRLAASGACAAALVGAAAGLGALGDKDLWPPTVPVSGERCTIATKGCLATALTFNMFE